jgi:Uncharacterized protein conserved in bacteria
MEPTQFGWHEPKRQKTLSERGVDFVRMTLAFRDPGKLVWVDDRRDYGEVRYNMLAEVKGRLYHVTFTTRDDLIWIISARKANDREQRSYGRR